MLNMEQAIMRYSVEDVIRIFTDAPVRSDMVVELNIAQSMNRIAAAHLSIERAMKFVISEAGGEITKNHDLPSRFNQLRQYDADSATFLEEAFEEAVRHYGYNTNVTYMKHLQSLETYLQATGTDDHFQDIRYWELSQSTDASIARQISPTLHLELLHAVKAILLPSESRKDTVSQRVEWAIRYTMPHGSDLGYTTGSEKEVAVKAYSDWITGFTSHTEAVRQAFVTGIHNDTGFISDSLNEAYRKLALSTDPAVRYFAETLTILPKQQRDFIPDVKWLGSMDFQSGMVSTPGGDLLGFINRRLDGTWAITPSKNGPIMVTAIAQNQTDARCYLADLLTRSVDVSFGEKEHQLRMVGDGLDLFNVQYITNDELLEEIFTIGDGIYKVSVWDNTHGIETGNDIIMKLTDKEYPSIREVLMGTVTNVQDHIVTMQGHTYIDSVE